VRHLPIEHARRRTHQRSNDNALVTFGTKRRRGCAVTAIATILLLPRRYP
jgi:hypothetical protein